MRYLKAVPRSTDAAPQARAVAVVSSDRRDVVYLEQPASIEIITEALKAWGLRVRAERDQQKAAQTPAAAPAVAPLDSADAAWQTTRPETKAPTRLENELSPLWLPIRSAPLGTEPVAAWGWFGRAA